MNVNTGRWYWISCLSLCLVVLGGCNKPEEKPESLKIVMAAQPSTSHEKQQSYAGEVQARQQTALAFRVGGQVTDRYVDVGDRVVKGQVLARLDVKDANLQLNAATAQLEQAKASALTAEQELKRFSQLLPDNAVSRSQFDAVKNQHNAAQSALKQAQANYEVLSNQTRYNALEANQSGVVTSRLIEVGQVVAPGQAAYQIAIDGEREVVIGVSEQAIAALRPNQSAIVMLWSNPDQRYDAFVREISPAADQSRTFAVKVAFRDRSAPIQLGQSARVFFQSTAQNHLYVPLPSVSSLDGKSYVWVIKPDHSLQRVWVTLGEYQRDSVAVLNGLEADQWVVIGGVHLLRDKQKVRIVDQNNNPIELGKNTPHAAQTQS